MHRDCLTYIMEMGGRKTDRTMKRVYRSTLADRAKTERDKMTSHFSDMFAEDPSKSCCNTCCIIPPKQQKAPDPIMEIQALKNKKPRSYWAFRPHQHPRGPYKKWRRRDSNPRPQRCERCALPTELRPHIMSGPVIGPDFYVVLSDSTIIAPFYKKERGISTFFHLPVSPCLYSLLISLCGGRKGSRDSSGGQRRHLRGCCSRCSEAGSQNRS